MAEIEKLLFENRDEAYRDFQSALIPTTDKESVIGVRIPLLRKIAKTLLKDSYFVKEELPLFLKTLPHRYYEENLLHSFFVSECDDLAISIELTKEFLPYVDNWAVCDTFNPKTFAKNKDVLWNYIEEWLDADKTYTVRFGIVCAMRHYLDDEFTSEKFEKTIGVKSDEYYVKMAVAWYMSMALVKRYDVAVKALQDGRLETWTHNKSIQKTIESRQVSNEVKDYLRTLKRHD